MTDYVDVELDEEIIDKAKRYGLVELREDGNYYLSPLGNEAVSAYLTEELTKLVPCPKCNQKAYLDNDYICRECRYGTTDGVVITGY